MNNPAPPIERIAAIIASCSWQSPSTSFVLKLKHSGTADFIVQNHGTIWTFYPRSQVAQSWWADHVEHGPGLGRNHAVEHRYAQDIWRGCRATVSRPGTGGRNEGRRPH